MPQDQENENNIGLKGDSTIVEVNETGFMEQEVANNDFSNNFLPLADKTAGGRHDDHVVNYLSRWTKRGVGGAPYYTFYENYLNMDPIKEKLHGSYGVTGTLGCKVVWNTQPFIQGLYILYYRPPYGFDDIRPTYATGCPHVLLNIAETTSGEIFVPYVGETGYIPLDRSDQRLAGQVGGFNVVPISPARGPAGPVDIQFTFYMCLRDAKTFGQYAKLPNVQAASLLTSVAEAAKKGKWVSGTTQRISDWLNKNKEEDTMGTVSRAGGWAFGGLTKVLDLMGWSKPLNINTPIPVINMPYADTCTTDAVFTGMKFANNMDQSLARIDMSDNGKDQLMIRNFCRKELLPRDITWDASNNPGDLLLELPYNPAKWYVQHGPDYTMNHLTYLTAVLFNYWRGSIKLTIQPVMTKFHSGRIRVVYSPGLTDTTEELANQALTYNWIVDLSDPSSWTIEIPYVSITPWRDSNIDAGTLRIYTETALSVSPSVSNSVDICLFVELTDSFEVAVSNTGVHLTEDGNTALFYPQTLVALRDIPETQNADLVFVDPASASSDAHNLSIGDPVRSLRAALKRFFLSRIVAADASYICYNHPLIYKSTYTDNDIPPDFITLVGMNFGFWRGSMRYVITSYGVQKVEFNQRPYAIADNSTNGVSLTNPPDSFASQTTVITPLDVPCKFELPYYSRTICSNIRKFTGTAPFNLIPSTGYAHVHSIVAGSDNHVSRAVGDDFDFGFLVGPPLMRRKLKS